MRPERAAADPPESFFAGFLSNSRRTPNGNTIIDIVESFGASNVRVFGSVARGHTHDGSDVDLLIDVPAGTGLITIERTADAIDAAVTWRVDIVTSGAAQGRMAHIVDEAVAL